MWKFQSPNDLQTILKNLKNDTIDRFPISLDVLSVLSDMSAKDVELELIRLGGKVTSYGDVNFLETIDLTASITEFVPQAVRTRDDVLGLLNYTRDHAEKVYASKTCNHVTACDNAKCTDNHYKPDMRSNTNVSLGFCSYLNLCKNLNCKYLHFKSSSLESASPIPPFSQYIKADIRRLDLSVFHSLVGAVVIDPPWDIHMELSYGTMTDSEMRSLNVGSIHDQGFIFVWATVRTLDVARDCIRTWGYEYVDDVVWVKTNQIGGTVRSGRTGHWFNHNKEHCLIGMKGDVNWSSFGYYRRDCDVIVAPVREASRKPDELYSLVERIMSDSGKYCLELFGRTHNLRNGWITVGNQLDGDFVTDQMLADRLARVLMQQEDEEVSCIGRRPSAPSPPSGLSLVAFEDVTPSPNAWLNSPLRQGSQRVHVLSLIGDLLDNGLIREQEAIDSIKFVMETLENVLAYSDLLEARKDLFGKARFVKLFLAGRSGDLTTPPFTSTPIVPATIFDCSSIDESATPVPLVYPKAIRIATVPIIGTAVWPCIRAATTEPKESPESAKSTNPGSSIEVSPPNNTLSLTRETTACSNTSPQTGWKAFSKKCAGSDDANAETCSSN